MTPKRNPHQKWPLPNEIEDLPLRCYSVLVPEEPHLLAAFRGALFELTRPYNWEDDPFHYALSVGALMLTCYDSLALCADSPAPSWQPFIEDLHGYYDGDLFDWYQPTEIVNEPPPTFHFRLLCGNSGDLDPVHVKIWFAKLPENSRVGGPVASINVEPTDGAGSGLGITGSWTDCFEIETPISTTGSFYLEDFIPVEIDLEMSALKVWMIDLIITGDFYCDVT